MQSWIQDSHIQDQDQDSVIQGPDQERGCQGSRPRPRRIHRRQFANAKPKIVSEEKPKSVQLYR